MTNDTTERTSLASFRFVGAYSGGVFFYIKIAGVDRTVSSAKVNIEDFKNGIYIITVDCNSQSVRQLVNSSFMKN